MQESNDTLVKVITTRRELIWLTLEEIDREPQNYAVGDDCFYQLYESSK